MVQLTELAQHMHVEEQASRDFSRARRRAFFRRLSAWLQNDLVSNRSVSFAQTQRTHMAYNNVYLGRETVEVAKIVGSVGRGREFDRAFLPTKSSVGAKWKQAASSFLQDGELPLVCLYKIGEAYFVWDGNHHVSVARYHRIEMVDAEVTELRALMHILRTPRKEEASNEVVIENGRSAPAVSSPTTGRSKTRKLLK
jgi:hypothetical protein